MECDLFYPENFSPKNSLISRKTQHYILILKKSERGGVSPPENYPKPLRECKISWDFSGVQRRHGKSFDCKKVNEAPLRSYKGDASAVLYDEKTGSTV